MFFPKKQSVYAASETQPTDNMPFITGVIIVIGYGLTQLELLGEIVLSAIGLFGNRLYVYQDDTRIYFAPRLFSRVSKRDICKIEPVSVENLSFWERLSSFNFGKKYLYRFTCYDTVLLLSSKDEAGMARLTADICARCNKTEEEETGTNNALGEKMAGFSYGNRSLVAGSAHMSFLSFFCLSKTENGSMSCVPTAQQNKSLAFIENARLSSLVRMFIRDLINNRNVQSYFKKRTFFTNPLL